ncbi:3-hydroxyisobutyrate dehydrogenase [Pelagimonas varians]|uniref:3-hydroxyisobutyrate dehydrogenase n=2 Tax=Pelagimonas varians TaxID=696760 RepID=A0A238KYZ5_9RHOB|nr:3-hydroxyisobutyrate dehydrogenase [Pelagimonas varians]PYG27609.1 3-hydroxyisobutyrate dehydrogenase [Pelagimonas varians]SMX47860.1 3-hydroxyisobutyrate dehydrogenase [Pelagimonas varians]
MSDIDIRTEGRAGRITLTRPKALNALSYDMCIALEKAIDRWRNDPDVALVIIDAEGPKAFCAGGDIAEMYRTGMDGNFDFGRKFWRDEYRMNAKLAEYPKPVVSFLQGFTMGGGVGVGCHGSHRIVGDSSQIAMPECGIGLIPDVGGTYLLSRAPGRLGEYIGLTASRMGPGDAVYTGFADFYAPEDSWDTIKATLIETGDAATIRNMAQATPESPLAATQPQIDALFSGESFGDIRNLLDNSTGEVAEKALKAINRNSPLSMALTIEMLHRLRAPSLTIRKALELEYRVSHRVMEHGDFLEGIRAAIIDKDKSPKWQFADGDVPAIAISKMLMPLGRDSLDFREDGMKIGFIGLGNMGGPMAANLVKAGHTVTGYDVAGVTIDGASSASTAAEAATGADVVITMLPNGGILRSVADDVIPAMKPGAVLLDCSTVDVESARDVAAQAAKAGVGALDAPVSGGVGGASGGTLTFMVGGSQAAFETAKPLFDIMGQKAVHCGEAGNGQAAKICNNMILGVTMIATCEAFALADKLGLSREAMFDVVSTSSGYSWSMNAYCPAPGVGPKSPADNGYLPGFAAELMLKDLRLSQQAAEAADADTPMGEAATALYSQFVENEDGLGRDFSAMLPRFETKSRG